MYAILCPLCVSGILPPQKLRHFEYLHLSNSSPRTCFTTDLVVPSGVKAVNYNSIFHSHKKD